MAKKKPTAKAQKATRGKGTILVIGPRRHRFTIPESKEWVLDRCLVDLGFITIVRQYSDPNVRFQNSNGPFVEPKAGFAGAVVGGRSHGAGSNPYWRVVGDAGTAVEADFWFAYPLLPSVPLPTFGPIAREVGPLRIDFSHHQMRHTIATRLDEGWRMSVKNRSTIRYDLVTTDPRTPNNDVLERIPIAPRGRGTASIWGDWHIEVLTANSNGAFDFKAEITFEHQ